MYNSNNNYAAARARNHYEFYYGGMMYSPFNTYYTQYNVYKPKLVISYDLASINPWVDVGDDSIVDYQHPGELDQRLTLSGYQGAMNNYLRTHLPDEVDDYGNEWTYVPIRFGGDTAGKIVFNNLSIDYDYTATVHYNPTTETAIRELNALVPSTEEGYTLVPINVTSATDGMINLDNLKMTGTKPNYRPTAMEIPDVETDEGSINSELVPISDYFGDVDQDPTTLQYKIQKNDQPGHVDLYLTQEPSRAGKVYLGIDTSKDENWNGVVTTQVSATDDEGKDVWSNEFKIGVEAVNDHPYVDYDLPEISGTEGIDSILVEYNAPSGRDVATGKVSFLMSADGVPYFNDIEGDRIYLDFELLRPDGAVANVERENEDGYRIYRGDGNELTLYVLPPEYTDDPDNFVVMVGSDPDYSSDESNYELRIYTSDVETDRKGETYFDIPIVIGSVNDPPRISAIPDIVMDEDTSYVGSVEFVNEYLTDIDNDVSELVLDFEPSNSAVHIVLTDEGYVSIELDMDFSGVVPVTLTVTDGETEVTSTFNVRIRAINDPPVVVVSNLYENRVIDDMFFIRGTGDDIEKGLRWVEVGVTKYGEFLYEDDWSEADGAYVWQYLVDIRNLDDGMYTIYIRAYDGRDYSEVQVYNVVVETPKPQPPSDPPVVTIESLLDGLQGGNVGIEGTATDESGYVEFVEYRIDGDLWRKAALTGEEWETVVNTRLLTNTEHNLSVRGYDGKSYSEVVFLKFAVYNEDSDLDGISNEMEQRLLMDPFNSLDGTMDFDEDGFSNAQEIEASTDPFDGNSHPVVDEEGDVISVWALVFIGVAIIVTILILGLFLLNIRLERNIHQWREDLQRRRMERKPKTLLQKIVELAPVYAGGYGMQDMGLALPAQPPMDKPALPPMEEQK